ncbi:hypothetical protein XarbCFBP8142_19855 [Xanthomonas arboricola]|nr:hypothetical protein XarbCFBP8142_19855 [Xanthomonas arboricola]
MDAEPLYLRGEKTPLTHHWRAWRKCGLGARSGGPGKDALKPHLHQNKRVIGSKEADQTAVHRTTVQGTRLATMHTDHLDGSLPAHRRGTLRGMDAAKEPTRTYLRLVLRWCAGKGLAAKSQIRRSATELFVLQVGRSATHRATKISPR